MRGRKPSGRPEGLRQVAVRGANVKPRLATGRSPTFSVKGAAGSRIAARGQASRLLKRYSSVSRMLNTARKLITPATAM